ncbi:MAG: hypothetical protein IPM50_01200 [Acidobacteriota bacterium]|nr:MAG: hypothetical protein IPM50_01200 [Acidobacteriota bacterium]
MRLLSFSFIPDPADPPDSPFNSSAQERLCKPGDLGKTGRLVYTDPKYVSRSRDNGLFSRDIGLISRDNGLISRDIGLISRDIGLISRDIGLISRDIGLISRDIGLISRDIGLKSLENALKKLIPGEKPAKMTRFEVARFDIARSSMLITYCISEV